MGDKGKLIDRPKASAPDASGQISSLWLKLGNNCMQLEQAGKCTGIRVNSMTTLDAGA